MTPTLAGQQISLYFIDVLLQDVDSVLALVGEKAEEEMTATLGLGAITDELV